MDFSNKKTEFCLSSFEEIQLPPFFLLGCRIGCPLSLAGIEITASSAVRVLRCVLRDCEVRLFFGIVAGNFHQPPKYEKTCPLQKYQKKPSTNQTARRKKTSQFDVQYQHCLPLLPGETFCRWAFQWQVLLLPSWRLISGALESHHLTPWSLTFPVADGSYIFRGELS